MERGTEHDFHAKQSWFCTLLFYASTSGFVAGIALTISSSPV